MYRFWGQPSPRRLDVTALAGLMALTTVSAAEAQNGTLRRLIVTTETSARENAGTDASLYLAVHWRSGSEARGKLYKFPGNPGDDTEAGRTDRFEFNVDDSIGIADICGLTLISGMNGGSPDWHVRRVQIVGENQNREQFSLTDTEVDRWLANSTGPGPAVALPVRIQPLGQASVSGISGRPAPPPQRPVKPRVDKRP